MRKGTWVLTAEIAFFACFMLILTASDGVAQKARVEMFPEGYVQQVPIEGDIEQLKDGTEVPVGYVQVGRGRFHAGIVTIHCGERKMIAMAEDKAREIGADTFRFYDVKEPDGILNTCYRAKILFLRKIAIPVPLGSN